PAPQETQQLQAGGTDISPDEDPGEAGPCPSPPPGELISGPETVRLSTWHWGDDAVIYLLHRCLSHLEKTGRAVRIMFFDFSSVFNTILKVFLRDRLELTGVVHHLTAWILDYLTTPQYARIRGCESDTVVCSMGALQGTVLAPFLFTLYTADFTHNSANCHLQKFSDDSASSASSQTGTTGSTEK
ncbi:hypothetical protein LDENG_00042650, partial [Lucifuga dentata]